MPPAETYDAMLERAYRAPPGTCGAILERAAAIYRKTRKEVCDDFRARFGGDAGH